MSSAVTDAPEAEDVDDDGPVDIGAILPETDLITVNDVTCEIRPLKTRELLTLLRVLTSGIGGALNSARLDMTNAKTVGRDLGSLFLIAAPQAQDWLLVFLSQMVKAVNDEDHSKIVGYLQDNPDPIDMMNVFEAVIEREAPNLVQIGGKLQAMWSRIANLLETASK